jgi:hypothetical protein
MEDKLFRVFVELRERFSVADIVSLFEVSETKGRAFEALRVKFFRVA